MKNITYEHRSSLPFQLITKDHQLYLMLKIVGDDPPCKVTCHYSDPSEADYAKTGERTFYLKSCGMESRSFSSNITYYFISISLTTHKLRYYFTCEIEGTIFCIDERGIYQNRDEDTIRGFFVNYVYYDDKYDLPQSMKNRIWYQIFPDRFCNDTYISMDYPDLRDDKYRRYEFGGTLRGIESRLAYIKNLGCSGIYLNPIFYAHSVHKYDTIDYYRIDPLFGSEEDFRSLVDTCHQMGIKVMLDGVYNHGSHLSPQFLNLIEKGESSPYKDWFLLQDKSTYDVHAQYEQAKNHPYEVFGFVSSMPKWNTQNKEVQEYLIQSAEQWTRDYNIDAWRLDVPDEVNDQFLREYKKRLESVNREVYIIGEIWSDPSHWLQGDMFHGVMNYTLYYAIRDYVSEKSTVTQFVEQLKKYYYETPLKIQEGMFNFCGNHDLPRITHFCQYNIKKTLLTYAISLFMPGNFSCYYGDEIFMEGEADPANRGVFPWGQELQEKEEYLILKKLFHIYNTYSRSHLEITDIRIEGTLIFIQRRTENRKNTLVFNAGSSQKIIEGSSDITTGRDVTCGVSLGMYEFAYMQEWK